VTGIGYLAVGFGLVWLFLAVYLVWLGHLQNVLRRRLSELDQSGRSTDE
jgi:CcmD family protein